MLNCYARSLAAKASTAILLVGGMLAVDSSLTTAAAEGLAAPSPPANVSARAGVNAAKIYWEPPVDDGGEPVSSYTVTSSPEGKTCTGSAAARSCYVKSLTNGQPYTFTVTATNASGTSAPATTNTVTPAADTTAPVLVSTEVTPDRASSLGGSTITVRLRITDDLSGRAPVTGPLDANPAILFKRRTGDYATFGFTRAVNRISGDEYDGIYQATVSVPAGTSAGYWDLSVYPIRDAADNSTGFVTRPGVLVGAPAAPTAVTATTGPGRQVTVSWQAPSDNGGNIITSYQLTDSHTGTTRTVTATTWTGSFPDIAADEPLTFTVAAVNAAGSSAASAPSPAVIVPAEAPSPVRNASAVRGDQSAAVDWDAPMHTHGAPVTGYTVTADPGGQQVTVEPGATQTTVPGLTNGVAYTFTITATNAAGTSEGVAAGPVTPAGVPQTVADVTATASDRSATVAWEQGDDNGAPVTGYKVTATPGGHQVTVGPDVTQATVPGLTNGVAYTFVVTATNSVGSSAPSVPSASVTPAGAPLAVPGLGIARGDRQLTVSWSAANGNGSPVTGYRVAYNDSVLELPADARSALLTGLSNGTSYRVTVTAVNALGQGTTSAATGTPATRPGTVAKPAVKVVGRNVTLTWRAPASNGAPITGFVITGGKPAAKTVNGGVRRFVFRNLKPGLYSFRVAAKNAVGAGAPSSGVRVRVR